MNSSKTHVIQSSGPSPCHPKIHDQITTRRDSKSDAQLIELIRRGNHQAFGDIVVRYENRLLRTLQRFVYDSDIARDIAQETFLRVYQRIARFDPSRRLGPWIFRMGINLAIDQWRRHKNHVKPLEKPDDLLHPKCRESSQNHSELSEEVHVVLNMLPEKFRTVILLRDLENFSCSEIAAILNRRESTIRWRLSQGRKRFRTLWEKREYKNHIIAR